MEKFKNSDNKNEEVAPKLNEIKAKLDKEYLDLLSITDGFNKNFKKEIHVNGKFNNDNKWVTYSDRHESEINDRERKKIIKRKFEQKMKSGEIKNIEGFDEVMEIIEEYVPIYVNIYDIWEKSDDDKHEIKNKDSVEYSEIVDKIKEYKNLILKIDSIFSSHKDDIVYEIYRRKIREYRNKT